MSDSFRPTILGALLECFVEFPLFKDDFDCLVDNGFIKQVSAEQCKWLKSKTCLAEYFWWVGSNAKRITGGFWNPISKAFGTDKKQLRKLAGRNGNWCKPDESRDFEVLKVLVIPYRQELYRIRREAAAYNAIKKLLNETKCDNPETIRNVLQKIDKLLCENVEKNE